jgi:ferritin-like metal-binding protein YciE
MSATKTLKDLFVDQLEDIYYAEKQLLKALPKMARAATHEELRTAFDNHLAQTESHVSKVENVFEVIGQKPRSSKCEAMMGLLKEGDEMAADHRGSASIDPALIAAAQKVEHYEIATYGCLQEWAAVLGYDAAEATLGEILEDEKNADELLTQVARSLCNESAVVATAS